ncbi:amino acid adenylation domain-containing protein [Streptomyces phaeofaciens]|uniref:amino acid adenylation domain-containing protein n=1 Tax=Streptomyces phaeofaciens TaxID=68254 RepID=UPI0036AC5EB2
MLFTHDLVLRRAEANGGCAAVVGGGGVLTYAGLADEADALAGCLRSLGAGPEVRVGVCLDRGPDHVTAVLAVLRAGGVYVPLVPDLPEERLAFIVADAGIDLVITSKAVDASLFAGVRHVLLVEDRPWRRGGFEVPDVALHPEHLAYLIYTSGSTGRPKGVAMPHGVLSNLLAWHRERLADDIRTILHASAIGFDVSFQETFLALTSGRTLVLPEGDRADPDAIIETVNRHQVDQIFLPFVGLDQLARTSVATGTPPRVKEIVTAGEQLNVTPAIRAMARAIPGVRLLNQYGPSETHVVTEFRLTGNPDTWPELPPIGSPVSGVSVRILDERLRPVPRGGTGEICLGGLAVSRGYAGRPDLTAERYVPDPFESGGRLYRTGDLGYLDEDDDVCFLGRADTQVKVRGFRVELGEVEACLRRFPGVEEVACAVRDGRLTAYLKTGNGTSPSPVEIREFAGRWLPGPMIPTMIVTLPGLPVTPNGKVDRLALPEPAHCRDAWAVGEYVAPRSPAEELVARVWAEVLEVDRVGAQDAFFDIGGDSLRATRVVARLRAETGLPIRLHQFYDAGTVAALAAALTTTDAEPETTQQAVGESEPTASAADAQADPSRAGLWLLDEASAGSPVHTVPLAFRFDGPLDPDALRRALTAVAARHAPLRTRPVRTAAGLGTVVAPVGTPLSFDIEEAVSDAEAAELIRRAAARPFDLTAETPARATLIRQSDDLHHLLWTAHHSAWDGRSAAIFAHELTALYSGAVLPQRASVPAGRPDSAAYRQAALDFWNRQLAGVESGTELPSGRPRPAGPDYAGETRWYGLGPARTARLRACARDHGTTPFVVLLAAFKAQLLRHSGEPDVVVGTVSEGRKEPGTQDLIGYHAATVTLRTDLSGDPSFSELLTRVRRTVADAAEHDGIAFADVVAALAPPRRANLNPLFQIAFVQDIPVPPLTLPGVDARAVPADNGTSPFDLTVFVRDDTDGIAAGFEYRTALYDEATIERLHTQLATLLDAFLADTSRPLSEAALLDAEGTAAAVRTATGPRRAVPAAFVHHTVFRRAAEAGDRPAVIGGSGTRTYQELAAEADALAGLLRRLGVRPEVRVGVCVERGPDQITAMLAVWRAGGVYVPLSADLPEERLTYMVADAGLDLVVASRSAAGDWLTGVRNVLWVEDRPWDGEPGLGDADTELHPAHLAYLIYTSGSTGRPKGVAVPHEQLMNFAATREHFYAENQPGRFLLMISPVFDGSLAVIVQALVLGAAIVVPSPSITSDIEGFGRAVEAHGVTHVLLGPQLWQQVLDSGDHRLPGTLRMVICAGENLPAELVARHRRELPDVELVNEYGPTEGTVWATATHCDVPEDSYASIGFPVANAQVHVLDAALRPVGPGVVGEIFIGGSGVTRGYVGRPDLTAERFVPDPFTPGARLYRTGDLAVVTGTGALRFLGRADAQVKIRGYRVELGEVEACLRRFPGVTQAVCAVRTSASGERRMVAYLAVGEAAAPSAAEVRAFAGRWLPAPMLPSVFVCLPRLPLTANGKVDRRALPEPETQPAAAGDHVAPRTDTERRLAAIWAEVLGVERVGVEDGFFDLGGHSLLAVRLQQALAEPRLTIADLFAHPTVASLASLLDGRSAPASAGQVRQRVQARLQARRAADRRRAARTD